MNCFLAQADLGQLPAGLLKYLVIGAVAMLVVGSFVAAAVFAGLQYFQSRRDEHRTTHTEIHPSPIEIAKAPKRFNKDFEDQRHAEIDRRLTVHDLEIERLRTEDMAIRADVTEKFDRISRALGRIEGKLSNPPTTTTQP